MLLRSSALPPSSGLADGLSLGSLLGATPRKPRRGWWLLLLCVLLLAVLLGIDMLRFAARARSYGRLAPEALALLPQPVLEREAIVVLTGDHGRIRKALELMRLRGSPRLIISGTGRRTTLTDLVNQQGDSTTNIHEIWKKIIIDPVSASTVENGVESGKILRALGSDRVLLVTSDYHMERSLKIFEGIAPGPRYYAVPVASEVAELGMHWSSTTTSALWKLWVEYWKLRLYTHYQARFVEALHPVEVEKK